MPINRARTPPSLFGIARRMAYAHKKYHSGIMWIGVISGFAGIKFSGSVRSVGERVDKDRRARIRRAYPKRSLMV